MGKVFRFSESFLRVFWCCGNLGKVLGLRDILGNVLGFSENLGKVLNRLSIWERF